MTIAKRFLETGLEQKEASIKIFKGMYYLIVSLFLATTLKYAFQHSPIIEYTIDLMIIITTITLHIINNKVNKKMKQRKKEEENKK